MGSGMVPFERALVSSYRPVHSNFFSIFTRFRDIAVLLSRTPLFLYPTYSLPRIFPCSPGNILNIFATKSADVGLIVRAISFQDFQPM